MGIPAYQIFRKLVNHFPRRKVTRRHDPGLCIECPYNLFSISLNPMMPNSIILFKLLVQLQGFAVTADIRISTAVRLTSIHSCQPIGRIPIVTLREASENLEVYQFTMRLTGEHPT